MSDPRRILDGNEARGLERRLLEAGSSVRLSSGRKALLWQTIAARVPASPDHGPEAPDPAAHPTAPPEGIHALPASPDHAGQGPAAPPQAGPAGPHQTGPAASDLPAAAPPSAPPPPAPLDAPPEPIAGLPAPLAASGVKIAVGAVILALGGFGYLRSITPASAPVEAGRRPETATLVASVTLPALVTSATLTPSPRPLALEARPEPSGGVVLAVPPTRREPTSEAAPRAPASDPTPLASAASAAPATSAPALPEPPAAPSASAPRTAAEIAQQERVSRMKEEAEMTGAARSALRAGNAVEALRLLEEVRAKFGGGLMGQEREALTIEALARSGQRAQAQTRAEAFLKAFPKSPHAADVRMFVP